jgi:hypothetical protein
MQEICSSKMKKTSNCKLTDTYHGRALANHCCRVHKLLHWWIGLKACNVILARERLDRERRKKAENRQARAEAEHASQHGDVPPSFVALAPNSVLHDVDTGSHGSPMSSSAMLTPPESGESPTNGPRESTAANGGEPSQSSAFAAINGHHSQGTQQQQNITDRVWSRFPAGDPRIAIQQQLTAQHQQQLTAKHQSNIMGRQVAEQVAQLVGSFRIAESGREKVPQSNTSVPYRGLDYDSLRALRAYIYNEETGAHVEEEALLDRLERVWRECVRADSEKLLEDLASFVVRERAFLTWIELKRHMAAFERAEKRMSTYQSLRTTY